MMIYVRHPNGKVEEKHVPSHVMTRLFRRSPMLDPFFLLSLTEYPTIERSVFLEAKRKAARNPYLPAVCRRVVASIQRSTYAARKRSATLPATPLKAKAVTSRTSLE